MTKIKNRDSLVKTPKTVKKTNSTSRITKKYLKYLKNPKKIDILQNKSTNKSQVDVTEGETINISKDAESPKRQRYSVQNRENIDANSTINLCEEDEVINNDITTPTTNTSDVIIDITENSIADGNLTSEEPEIIEIKNTSTEDSIFIDLSADDSTRCINQDIDDIVVLHTKYVPDKNEIEILSHKKLPRKKPTPSPKSTPPRNSKSKKTSPTLQLNIGNSSSLDYIPLDSNKNNEKNVNNNHFNGPLYNNTVVGKKVKKRRLKKSMKMLKRLSTNSLSPKSKLEAIGTNVYSDKPVMLPSSGLRPIIIDGSNVAYHHSNNRHFSCKGLEICINYFKQKGHKVTAFVPQYRVKMNRCDNPRLLNQLVQQGDVILTPSRVVDGQPIVPYDDRYIVQTAALKGGIIVTKDNYNDLLAENPAWTETIKYRLLQFTWVDDLLMFPSDPLGSRGPNLETFLRF